MPLKRFYAPEGLAPPALFAALLLAGCTHSSSSPEGCVERFWIHPADALSSVELVGSWDSFARPGIALTARSDGWFTAERAVSTGSMQYAFVVDGRWTRDITEPLEEVAKGQPVTRRDVADCRAPQLSLASVRVESAALRFGVTLVGASDGTPFVALDVRDEGSGKTVPVALDATQRGTIDVALPVPSAPRFAFTVTGTDALGRRTSRRSFAWTDGHTDADRIGYQVLPDRFRGPGGSPLSNPANPAMRAGGTLSGVTAELRRGTFDALAVDTLWLMPIVQNTSNSFDIGDGALGTGYHGYWATSSSQVDANLGNEGDVRELLDVAHARGIRVVLDVIPNHVHAEHPYWRDHRADGWFHGDPGACVCGSVACPWETSMERCAFSAYLPDVNWDEPAAADTVTADTVNWLERFPFDGLRIDAVPMMPRGASRAIVARARDRVAQGSRDLLLLGEVFTGPGAYDKLRYYLGPFGLSSTFHFPLFWALRGAFADETGPLSGVTDAVSQGALAWGDSGATLATFAGNHDVSRLASVAEGSGADRFALPPFASDARTWSRLRQTFVALYTLPGFPMLYQGDEIGLPGTGDPSSRRVLPDRADLPADAVALERHVQALARLRRCSTALRRGALEVLHASDEALVFGRRDPASNEATLVVLTRTPNAVLHVPLPAAYGGSVRDVLQGTAASLRDELTIPSGAVRTSAIWLPSTSPCTAP